MTQLVKRPAASETFEADNSPSKPDKHTRKSPRSSILCNVDAQKVPVAMDARPAAFGRYFL
jgi:hypothetical protein